jgi:ABC-2 type transport system permease protein
MKKYWSIFKISFQEEFAYKLNFILWRVRNVFQILLTYFLWNTVFANPQLVLFGYDRPKILTYVFGIMIVRALVLSARAMDVAGDIAQGDLSNYLLKPMSYFKYWFTRDLSSKALNLGFAAVEFTALFLILRPPFYFQTDIFMLITFILCVVIAMLIYFLLLFLISSVPFWAPELGWGSHFLVTVVIIEALSGTLFPINILPDYWENIAMSLPFPYLVYFPVQVYLGNITGPDLIRGIIISAAWVVILWVVLKQVWQRGLKVYESVGR